MKYYIEYLERHDDPPIVHNATVEAGDIKDAIAKFEQESVQPVRIINVSLISNA